MATPPLLQLVHNSDTPELVLTIREFLLAKRAEQLAASTITKYEYRLGQFADWLTIRHISRPAGISRLHLRGWAASLPADWQPSTTRHVIITIRAFIRWLADEGHVDESLALALKPPRAKSRVQRTLSREEVDRLIAACDSSPFGVRDAAIVSLMVDSGLRASELCRLEIDDIVFDFPFDGRRINFATVISKGGDKDLVHFGSNTAALIRAWRAVRPAMPGVATLFVSLRGRSSLRPLTRFGLFELLRLLGQKAGVPGVTPHSLRRTFALLLEDSGHSTRHIQALGRWKDIKMVEAYTRALRAGKGYRAPMDQS